MFLVVLHPSTPVPIFEQIGNSERREGAHGTAPSSRRRVGG